MDSVTRREREKAARRAAILDAAEALFLAGGYDETTMDDIVLASGFSKRTIYQYFAGKGDLLAAIALRKARDLEGLYEEAARGEASALGKIHAMTEAFFRYFLERPDWYSLMTFTKATASGTSSYISTWSREALGMRSEAPIFPAL